MSVYGDIADALRGHKMDYDEGRTQNFSSVFIDCAAAAVALNDLEASLSHELEQVSLLRLRLEHLLISETIRKYDEHNRETREYARDIRMLDVSMKMLDDLIAAQREAEHENECKAECNNIDATALNVLYLCDRRKCDRCNPECMHTEDVRHAKHFEVSDYGGMIIEQEG